jgi:RNA polymerase sigma factor (sigma-70 family)
VTPEGEPLDDAGWQSLYRRLERPLFNLAYRYVWNREEAQDVVHDVFLRLWNRRAGLRAGTADRLLWVSVLNLARNRRRWLKLRRLFDSSDATVDLLTSGIGADEAVQREANATALRAAIDALPEKLREVLLLAEFADLRYEEIAAMLQVPVGTIASRRHLAVKQLRSRMSGGES